MYHPVLMYDVVVESARANNLKRAHRPLMETEARPGDHQAQRLSMIARARRSLGSIMVRTGTVLQGSPVHGIESPWTGGTTRLGRANIDY